MRGLLPKFNKMYGIEKSILTVITDGYSHSANILNQDEKKKMTSMSSWVMVILGMSKKRETSLTRSTEKFTSTYQTKDRWDRNDFDQTQNLLDWVGQTTGAIVTGYFVCGKNADMTNLLMVIGHETYKDYNYDKQNAMWKEIETMVL